VTRLAIVVNDLPFFVSHRLPIALAAQAAGLSVSIVGPPEPADLVSMLQSQGISVIPWFITRGGTNIVTEIMAVTSLIKIYHRLQPHIVHHVTHKPVLYGSFAAWCTRTPRVVNAIAGMGYAFINRGKSRGVVPQISRIMHRLAHRSQGTRANCKQWEQCGQVNCGLFEEVVLTPSCISPLNVFLITPL
jgi:hypothetical protein